MTQIAAGETQLALELEAFALKKKIYIFTGINRMMKHTSSVKSTKEKSSKLSIFFLVFAKPDMYPLPLFLPASLFHREKKIGRKVGKEMADICTLIYKRHIQRFS